MLPFCAFWGYNGEKQLGENIWQNLFVTREAKTHTSS